MPTRAEACLGFRATGSVNRGLGLVDKKDDSVLPRDGSVLPRDTCGDVIRGRAGSTYEDDSDISG